MARGSSGKGNGPPRVTIIRREDGAEAGHHGGAWKVAYADFVTAMMAFFLLMWLLNATTDKQRRGIAAYFSPTDTMGQASTGSGQPFGGHTPFDEGSLVSDKGTLEVINGPRPPVDAEDDDSDTPAAPRPHRKDTPTDKPDAGKDQAAASVTGDLPPASVPAAARAKPEAREGAGSNLLAPNVLGAGVAPNGNPKGANASGANASGADPNVPAADGKAGAPTEAGRHAAAEKQAFEDAARAIRDAVRGDPALADLGHQLAIDTTPAGLRIQIMDEERLPMFATGSAAPNDRARRLLQKIAPILMHLTEDLSIAGYTDAAPYHRADRTNWELSAERANATRRMLAEAGLPDARVRSVTGNADRDPLLPADPLAAANRRIAIVVLCAAAAPSPPAPSPPAPAALPAAP